MKEDTSYFQNRKFKDALAAYERMVAGGEPADLDAETLTDIAEYYALHHREKEADRCIRYALSFYPDSVDPQIFLARQQMFHGHQKEAWRICNAISDQDDNEVMFLRAELKFRDTLDEDAFSELLDEYARMNAEHDPDTPNFLYDVITLFRDYERYDMAQKWIKEMEDKFPNHVQIIPLKAEIHNCKGEHVLAMNLIEKHITQFAFDINAWLQLGEAYMWLEHYNEAIEVTEYIFALEANNAEGLLLRANILYDTNELTQAHSYYERFLEQYPEDEKAIYLDAQCLIHMGAFQEAVPKLKQLIGLMEKRAHGYAYSFLAYCYKKMQQEDKFLHYFKLAEREPLNKLSDLFPDLYPKKENGQDDSLPF